jgi:molybdenum cofactor cytidylyltransferase
MTRAPSFCGVILAAGESSRMGRDKALLPWRGETFLTAAIHALQPWTDLVIVVAGKNAPMLIERVDATGAFLIVNPNAERGQFSSLQIGLQDVLNRGRDAAIVTLVDRPPAQVETIHALRSAFLASPAWAVVPEYEGKHGHPIVVGREMIEIFLKAAPAATAREIEHQHQERIAYVHVDDAAVVANVDTPEEYQRLNA